MESMRRMARDNMTTPRLLTAGAVALGAAAFALLRNERRREGIKEHARRLRDDLSRRMGHERDETIAPATMNKRQAMALP
jgi:hypothetical protein